MKLSNKIFTAFFVLVTVFILATTIYFFVHTNSEEGVTSPSGIPVQANNAASANPSAISYESLHNMAYSGQSEQAIKLSEEYLKTNDNSDVRILLARMLTWDHRYDAAKEQLTYVLSKHPGNRDAVEGLADIEMINNNYNQALTVVDNGLKFNPNNEGLLEKKETIHAEMLKSKHHTNQAISLVLNYLQQHDSPSMRLYLVSLYKSNNQNMEARKQLEILLGKTPDNTQARIALADMEIASGNYQLALAQIDTGLRYAPQNADLLNRRKQVLEKIQPGSTKNLVGNKTIPSKTTQLTPAVTTTTATTSTNKTSATPVATSTPATNSKTTATTTSATPSSTTVATGRSTTNATTSNSVNTTQSTNPVVKKTTGEAVVTSTSSSTVSTSHRRYARAHGRRHRGHHTAAYATEKVSVVNEAYPSTSSTVSETTTSSNTTPSGETTSIPTGSNLSYDSLKKMAHNHQSLQAIPLAQESLRRSENADVRTLLGLMLSWNGRYDEAREQFWLVLKRKPGYYDAVEGLANLEDWTDNDKQAIRVLNYGLKYHPNDKSFLALRAKLLTAMYKDTNPPYTMYFLRGSHLTPPEAGAKLNAIVLDQEMSYVDDLKQIWKISSIGYERATPYGPLIFTFNRTDRFRSAGTQYIVEAYPHLFPGGYMYLGYGRSNTSYLPQNYYGIEPFFSLPDSYEFSLGERYLQFQSGGVHLYTGSIGKYIGNYWFSFRPYVSSTASHSYFLSARRYFSSPDSYITVTVGGGTGPSFFTDPNSLSSNRSRSIRLDGEIPLTNSLIFTWLMEYASDHFPNRGDTRQETDVDAGLIWRF